MDEIQKGLLGVQSSKETAMKVVGDVFEDIDRISAGGFNNSERDRSIIQGLANLVIAEYREHLIMIELEGTKYV